MSTTLLDTIDHQIAGTSTAGISERTAPVYDPATGQVQRHVRLAEPADVDAAVQAAKARVREVERRVRHAPRARDVRASASWSHEHTDELARIISAEHGKTFDDAQGRGHPRDGGRRVRVRDRRADQGRVLRPGLDRRRSALVPAAAGRVRGDHAVQLPDHGPDVDAPGRDRDRQHVRAQAVRARPERLQPDRRALRAGRDCRTACSTSCTATRWRSTRCSTTRMSRRSASSARPRSPSTSTSARARAGKRVQALGGAKNHAIVMPDADLDFATNHLIAAGFGSAGQRCMAICDRGRGRRRRRRAGRAPAREGARDQGRPRARARLRDGPRHHRRVARPDHGLHRRHHRRRRGRRPRARASTATASGSARRCSTTSRTDMDVYREEIFGPVLASCASTRSTRRSS